MPGYYLVQTECFELPISCPRKPLSKRLSNALQLTQNGSSLCCPCSSPLMPNKNDLPSGSIKPTKTQASCSRDAMATIRCTLNALRFAWLLSGAHRMLRSLIFWSAKTIVETTRQRTAIDLKLIITVLPFTRPLMPNQNEWSGESIKQNTQASCSRVATVTI